jgi:hypothetical protein
VNKALFRLLPLAAALLAAGCTLKEGPPIVSPTKVLSMRTAPVKGADAKFAFAPITGAPSELIQTLEDEIKRHAAKRKLTLVPVGDPSAVYLVKGYVSAVGDSQGTLLVYVWDVLGQNGDRLRRVSGQENSGGAATDPWSGIDASAMTRAARNVVDELKAWSD